MTSIPDALTDHHMLVSSIGKEEDDDSGQFAHTEKTKDCVEKQIIENDKFVKGSVEATGHILQLEDGTTVFFPSLNPLINGQTVTLEDGTTAIVQTDEKNNTSGLQMVQLLDGSTAYITMVNDEDDNSTVNNSDLKNETNSFELVGVTENQCDEKTKDRVIYSGKEKSYKCNYDDCNKCYSTQHHLKVHERKHTGDKPFKCSVEACDKAFATSYSLKSHMRTHTGEKPYECPIESCAKSFKTSGDLQKHVRTHTGERPFRCTFEGCDRCFTTSNIRKVHMRTHTGERPYVCPEDGCDRSFASATNYKNHRRIHSGEKPYVCSIQGCNKRFTEYSSLYKHHIVHSQQKPYFCSVCSRNYRQAYSLTMHKRTAHGIIESEDGTEIVIDAELAAELFATTTKRKRSSLAIQSAEDLDEVCVQLEDVTDCVTDPRQTTTLIMQGTSAHSIQEVAKAAASCSSQTQILIVAEPAQIAALQQIGVQNASTTMLSSMKDQDDS